MIKIAATFILGMAVGSLGMVFLSEDDVAFIEPTGRIGYRSR